MKFKKENSLFKATRTDGQVITIEKSDCGSWIVRYENDEYGDSTAYFKTKKQAIEAENNIEEMIS